MSAKPYDLLIKNVRVVRPGGQTLATESIPGFLVDMVEAGGLLAQLQQRFFQRTPS